MVSCGVGVRRPILRQGTVASSTVGSPPFAQPSSSTTTTQRRRRTPTPRQPRRILRSAAPMPNSRDRRIRMCHWGRVTEFFRHYKGGVCLWSYKPLEHAYDAYTKYQRLEDVFGLFQKHFQRLVTTESLERAVIHQFGQNLKRQIQKDDLGIPIFFSAGEPPSPRAAHAAAAVGTMVLFQGGIGPAGHSTDDLYVLDMSNDKYRCPRYRYSTI
ncbi:serine/threonine-protein phosphatase BSL1 [Artemisia annua]|uniref:Serine/threonine-protein phosphatase BSL1 n=1 Tax=Artemisia annua TaxID=35608 RepID=A0A2U1MWR5_ARTAN|nr:serine/threonine-protein phosphatase BSL1 [Artemisia annua]